MKKRDYVSSVCCGDEMELLILAQCLKCGFEQKAKYESCIHMEETPRSENFASTGSDQCFGFPDGSYDHIHIGYWHCKYCGRTIRSQPVKYCNNCGQTFSPSSKRKFHNCTTSGSCYFGRGKVKIAL